MNDSERSTLSILIVEADHGVAELLLHLLNDVDGWGASAVHDAAGHTAILEVSRSAP